MEAFKLIAFILCGLSVFNSCYGEGPTKPTICDFVIVGSGTGSLAVGGLLADVPYWRICILERGPLETKMDGWYTNNYKFTSPHDPMWLTTPALQTLQEDGKKKKDGRNIYIPRFRGRGGTSRVYGAINRRASPSVLALWPPGWQNDNLTHYYKRMEDHYCYYDSEEITGVSPEDCKKWHGKGGAMQVNTQMEEAFQLFSKEMQYICEDEKRPWKGYAHDYNGRVEDRISCSVFQQFKLRTEKDFTPTYEARNDRASQTARGSSFTGYYQRKKNKPELFHSLTVTKILFEEGKAVGVLCLDTSTHKILTVRARKEVIVGGGAFDTPHLLQVSGVGPLTILNKIKVDVIADNPHVGQNLWDHISVPYVLKMTPESDDLCCPWSTNEVPKVNIDGKIYETAKLSSINGPFTWILHYRSNLTRTPINMSDIQLYVMGNSKLFDETGSLCTSSSHNEPKEYSHQGDEDDYPDSKDFNEGTIRIIDQWPEYRGSINASTSNIFDKPQLDYGWTYTIDGKPTEEFKKVSKLFRDQIRLLRDMFFGDKVHEGLRALIVDEVAPGKSVDTDEEIDDWLRGMCVSALHPTGTCKMPECADEFLQVNGVSNLRVCDASAFATQIDGNPAATLFAMGEKLADMIKFQYLKYIKVAIRLDYMLPIDTREQHAYAEISAIKSVTNCMEVSVEEDWISTGKDTWALIHKWSLICSEESNERAIADTVIKATLDLHDDIGGCTANGIPSFNRKEVPVYIQEPTPKHEESSFIFVVWCQSFTMVNPRDMWDTVGKWKGEGGTVPGSRYCFELNCENKACIFLEYYNASKRELIYSEPDLPLPVTNYISTKKVVSINNGKSSSYVRTGSVRSNPGADWYKQIAGYLLENVYASDGYRLSTQFPPLNRQNGWWRQTPDGLLYYKSKDVKSSSHVAAFDLDGTLIQTKSGEKFPRDENDWVFRDGVVSKLRQNNRDGFNNVVMSNQKGIGMGNQNKKEWMTKIENIASELDIPVYVLAAIEDNIYRKPSVGMWNYYACKLNQFYTVDLTDALYVGDADGQEGRPNSDKKFAENVGLHFYNPEEYFDSTITTQHEDL